MPDLLIIMTSFPKPFDPASSFSAVYDAWNRMVEVKSGQTTVGRYYFDGLNRRIRCDSDSQSRPGGSPDGVDTYQHCYFNTGWQMLETRRTGTSGDSPENIQPECQYVWSIRYVDAMILRDKNTDTDGLCDDQRLYALSDANFNVTAIIATDGTVQERYIYDPYGQRTILDADWSADADGVSDFGWVHGHQGLAEDPETGLVQNRRRMYIVNLGRFLQPDVLGYADGLCLYEYVRSDPISSRDPSGLMVQHRDSRRKDEFMGFVWKRSIEDKETGTFRRFAAEIDISLTHGKTTSNTYAYKGSLKSYVKGETPILIKGGVEGSGEWSSTDAETSFDTVAERARRRALAGVTYREVTRQMWETEYEMTIQTYVDEWCHDEADPDLVGRALALAGRDWAKKKDVTVIRPGDPLGHVKERLRTGNWTTTTETRRTVLEPTGQRRKFGGEMAIIKRGDVAVFLDWNEAERDAMKWVQQVVFNEIHAGVPHVPLPGQ